MLRALSLLVSVEEEAIFKSGFVQPLHANERREEADLSVYKLSFSPSPLTFQYPRAKRRGPTL